MPEQKHLQMSVYMYICLGALLAAIACLAESTAQLSAECVENMAAVHLTVISEL